MIYKRGKFYPYKFLWYGELASEFTKPGTTRLRAVLVIVGPKRAGVCSLRGLGAAASIGFDESPASGISEHRRSSSSPPRIPGKCESAPAGQRIVRHEHCSLLHFFLRDFAPARRSPCERA